MATGIRLTRLDQNHIMARFMEGQSPACAAMDYVKLNYPGKRIQGLEWHRIGLRCIRSVARRLGWSEKFLLEDLEGERATRKH